jgi:peptidoglycan/xylan/chitin deacetylase (PgdA/CDA1 family)
MLPIMQKIALASGLSSKLGARKSSAQIIMFHGIGDDWHSSVEVFEKQLKLLKRDFDIISLDSLLSSLKAGDSLRKKVVLTFDDGLRNNFQFAYPLLKQYDAPATFYVCPGLMESGKWLWNHEARERWLALSDSDRINLAGQWGVDHDVKTLIEWLKTKPQDMRLKLEDELSQKTQGFAPTADQRRNFDIMNWEELMQLDPELITIGSHTVSHPITKGLKAENVRMEIRESRRLLEEKLSRPVNHFCYPDGAYDETVVAEVRETYCSAVTTKQGIVNVKDDQYLLSRTPAANTPHCFAWRLWRPGS